MCFNDEYIRMTRLLIIMPDIMILNRTLLTDTGNNFIIIITRYGRLFAIFVVINYGKQFRCHFIFDHKQFAMEIATLTKDIIMKWT